MIKEEIYDYPAILKLYWGLLYGVVFLLLAGAALLGLLVAVASILGSPLGKYDWLTPDGSSPWPIIIGPLLMMYGFWALQLSSPRVVVHATGFRIEALFYRSQNLTWADLVAVKEKSFLWSTKPSLLVQVEGIHPVYALWAFTQQGRGRCFSISPWIKGYDELRQVIQSKLAAGQAHPDPSAD